MNDNATANVITVTLEDFEKEVIERSMTLPVVVSFWSARSATCQSFTPLLEKFAAEYGGRFVLASVDADTQMEIAQSFQIRSIPTVIALKGGQPVSAFQGAVPEAQVRAFLDKLVPSETEERVSKAKAMLAAGDANGARDDLRTALALNPGLDAARIVLADIAFRDNLLDEAEKYLSAVKPINRMDSDFERIATRIAAAREASQLPGAAALQARVDANADDFDARMQLATLYATENQFEPAFQLLIEIVQRDRKWNDDAARKKLVEFFTLAQPEQPALVSRYRRALATALN
jgi:putative thioredoxin